MMYIPNQLIGAPVNTQVTMECTTEASPKVTFLPSALNQKIAASESNPRGHTSDLSDLSLDLIPSNKMHKSNSTTGKVYI